jgi:7-keto-8-aminopelargonate synthetase-like enzyme
LGSSEKALEVAAFLKSQGIGCMPMRYPTVSHTHAGLRVILNSHHEYSDIKKLFKALSGVN